jgi:hypothetical protein
MAKYTEEQKLQAFWNKTERVGDCIEWRGALKSSKDYGVFYDNNKGITAHRWIFIKLNGYAPEVVMHTCDNPPCVNPEHLVGSTFVENNKDRANKGRNGKAAVSPTCPRGHERWGYYKDKDGYLNRQCKECARERSNNANKVSKQKAQGKPSI